MTVSDAVVGMVVDALPGAYLWDDGTANDPPAGDLIVFDGRVPPLPPLRYVVVYIGGGLLEMSSVASMADVTAFRFQVTTVAPDSLQARWLTARVNAGIVGRRPVVDGPSLGLIEHTLSRIPQRDEQVQERSVVYVVDQYQLLAAS